MKPDSLSTEQIRIFNAQLQRLNPAMRGYGVSRHELVSLLGGMSPSQRDAMARGMTGSQSISWGSLMQLHQSAAELLHPTTQMMTELARLRMTPQQAVKVIARQMGITNGEYVRELIDAGGARDGLNFVADSMGKKPAEPEPEGLKALRERHKPYADDNADRRARIEAAMMEASNAPDAPGRAAWQKMMAGEEPASARAPEGKAPSLREAIVSAVHQEMRNDEFGHPHLRNVRELELAERGDDYLTAAAYGQMPEADYSDLAPVDQFHKIDGGLGDWNSAPPAPDAGSIGGQDGSIGQE